MNASREIPLCIEYKSSPKSGLRRTTLAPERGTGRWVVILLSFWFLFGVGFPREVPAGEPASEELGFMEIEDVFAAAKHLQAIREAPSSVTVVTDEEIRRYGHRNMTDIAKNVRSFYTYSDRNYEYIGVRGFARLGDYGNRVLQLIDGHTYNDNVYGSFFMGHVPGLDMDAIKRVEFIRGPGSSLYGSNALFGIVNIIPKKGEDINGLKAKAEAGSYGTYLGSVIYGKTFASRLDVIASVTLTESAGQDHYYGEFDDPAAFSGWARDGDGERNRKCFVKATLGELSFLASMSRSEKHVPTASYYTIFNDNRFKTVDERDFAELKWEHAADDRNRILARIYLDRYEYEGIYPSDYPPVTLNIDEALGHWAGTEVNFTHEFAASRLLLGGEANYHLDADQKNYDDHPSFTYLDDSRSFTTWSAFVQEEWDVISWLRLLAGLRYDHYSTFGKRLSPRAALIFKPAADSTLKLLYGEAFRAPNVFELYYHVASGESVSLANPDLKPEVVKTYEVVWEQGWIPILKTSVSVFRFDVKDLITQVEVDSCTQYRNVSRVRSDGLELGMEINWPGVAKGHVDYTYQETEDVSTGKRLANSPRSLMTSGVIVPVYRNTFAGLQCRYTGRRLDRDGESVGDALVADVTLSAEKVYGALNLSAGVYNLFDDRYADPVSSDHVQRSIEQNGRNFWFKIDYHF